LGNSHTVVVGGGIIGVCTAYYLARRGQRVTLLEKGTVGDSASGHNAGIVALGHLPLPRPGLAGQAFRWMFDPGSPLYIRPRFDLDLLTWLWDFHRACSWRQVSHCMRTLAALGRLSDRCWQEILATEAISCAFRPEGWLDVFRSEAGREAAARDAEITAGFGFAVEELDAAALPGGDRVFGADVRGGFLYPESSFLDPVRFLAALTERLPALGVEVRQATPVARLTCEDGRCTGVQTNGGEFIPADSTVLAAGIWSAELARAVGLRLPLQAGKGYYLDLEPPEPRLSTACVLVEAFVAVTPMGDRLRLAGTVELSGLDSRLNSRRLEMLRTGARKYLRGVAEAEVLARGYGLRPCTADGLPIVGRAPDRRGLFVATGHAKMGLSLGPATGRLVSEFILDGEPSLDISALRVDRS